MRRVYTSPPQAVGHAGHPVQLSDASREEESKSFNPSISNNNCSRGSSDDDDDDDASTQTHTEPSIATTP